MNTIRHITAGLLIAVALVVVPALLSAHEVTHNGTVVALTTAKYAQPSGGTREVRELEVAVVDPKTKKVANRVFTITDKTTITRAGKPVSSADVTAQKDEKVAVVVDHDKPGDEAIRVQFAAAK
jgi:cell division septation protein DedD